MTSKINRLVWFFDTARRLPCFGAHTKHATLSLGFYDEFGSIGYQRGQHVGVSAGSDVAGALETIVHELAHVYCFNRYSQDVDHGPKFREILLAASRALGIDCADLNIKSRRTYAIDYALTQRYRSAIRKGLLSEHW